MNNSRRYTARNEFITNLHVIEDLIASGLSLIMIHEQLTQDSLITMNYKTLCKYIKKRVPKANIKSHTNSDFNQKKQTYQDVLVRDKEPTESRRGFNFDVNKKEEL